VAEGRISVGRIQKGDAMNHPVKYRNMFIQILLFIITLGIYSIYWYYQTVCEMKELVDDRETEPVLLTILLFVPLANLYSYYKHSELYEKMTTEHFNRWILFILWIVFCPVVWVLVQIDLNKRAEAGPSKAAGA
jgi:hypothetical protein